MKKLNEMTNEELWELFPIILTPYDPVWPLRYSEEEQMLKDVLGADIVRISHIGSTSVIGLTSKPTIDILIEITYETDLNILKDNLIKSGYIYSYQSDKPDPKMMFMKGYTESGFKGQVYHLHIRYLGDWDEILFRDYLRSHYEALKEYQELKLSLLPVFKHNRDGYTASKGDFIQRITELARQEREHDSLKSYERTTYKKNL
jgi:GrpB-like predicted nucleotidyltransferase (UPF0157 family)